MKRLLFILLLAGATSAHAQAFRCGTKLVTEGNTRGEVASKCGDPTEVDHSSIWVTPTVWINGVPVQAGNGMVEVPVELWLYNLGPNKLMRRIRFENGKVVAIETLGYGYTSNSNQ